MTFRALLVDEFRPYGELSEDQLAQLQQHYDLLMRWNRRLNLTRIRDTLEIVRFHYCESLFLGQVLPAGGLRIADLGSGPGFPGVPLAVIRPKSHVTLIEADQRKAVFLREATRDLGNVEVLAVRYQDSPNCFDWVVSRAVAPRDILKSGLARGFAVLVSSKDAPRDAEVVTLPWGRDRVVAVSRGTTVSRETIHGTI